MKLRTFNLIGKCLFLSAIIPSILSILMVITKLKLAIG